MSSRIEQLPRRVPVPRKEAPFDARETVCALARPRLSTTPGHEEVAAEVRWRFEDMGYETDEARFAFAPWVGRYALPAGGLGLLIGNLFGGILLLVGLPAWAAVALVLAGSIVLVIALNVKRALHHARWWRRNGVNFLFRPHGARPLYILMAHLDTKSQLVPLSVRALAIAAAVSAWVVLMAVSLISISQPVSEAVTFVTAVVGVLAATMITLSWADNDSPGALDNASGVATLLGVAQRELERGDVAFLVTDAEELGLVGARDAAHRLPPVHGVINVDGIDDRGHFFVMERYGYPRRGLAPHLTAAILMAATELGMPAIRRAVPLGVLVDHMPIMDAGIPALTVMRGNLSSLHRVHRPGDNVVRLHGTGVAMAVDLLCGALAILRQQEPSLA